jgi:hypothetical protein
MRDKMSAIVDLIEVASDVARLRGVVDTIYPDEEYDNLFDFVASQLISLEKENKELKEKLAEK